VCQSETAQLAAVYRSAPNQHADEPTFVTALFFFAFLFLTFTASFAKEIR
jgi:hypothetical protein